MKKVFFRSLVSIFLLELCGCCLVTSNLYPLQSGRAYRSGQMGEGTLKRTIEKYRIQTVVNLRGKRPNRDWFQEELVAVKEAGITHVNIGLSATRLPRKKQLIELLRVLETAQYPILIHCYAGADRTGLASVIYKLHIQEISLQRALRQLSITYCHAPVGPTTTLDDFFEYYRRDSQGRDIKTWILEDYSREKYTDD